MNIINMHQIIGLFKIIPGFIYAILIRSHKKKIWLFSERKGEARDNAVALFEYMSKNQQHISCYYAIEKKSKDYERLVNKDHIIEFGSVKHYAYYLASDAIVSSQKHNGPSELLTYIFRILNINNHKVVFLGHGITKDDAQWLHYENSKFRLFCCGACTEYEFVSGKFNYPPNNVVYTGGLCRYDLLVNASDIENENIILILPTWRNWLVKGDPKLLMIEKTDQFNKTTYYKAWMKLIGSNKLKEIADKYNVKFVFYPHPVMQNYCNDFKDNSEPWLIIANQNEYNLGQLIKDAKMIITDYSSVFFDFIFQNKPIIFYQFDYKNYRRYQYQEGYFDYGSTRVGDRFETIDPLLSELEVCINNNYKISEDYIKESSKHFPVRDNNNCERTYKAIYGAIYNKTGEANAR